MIKHNNILILTGIFPPDIGGPATQLDALARELIKYDYKVKVLTFGSSAELDNESYPYSVKRVSNRWPSFLKSFFYLINGLFYAFRADIIYNQDLYTAGLTGLIIKKIWRKPLVTRFVGDSAWETASVRGWVNDDILTFQEKRYSRKIERRKKIRKKILFDSDRVIVVSYFLKKLALKIGLTEEKIKVIYNSVDFIDVNLDLKTKDDFKRKFGFNGFVLLTIARLTPWKGVDTLIEIMPDLIKKYVRINLVVVGTGTELDNLKRLAQKLNVEKKVFFQGKLSRQGINEYLTAADLFLLNTNYEGMSHTILEAMKIGAPVITTNIGGNPETVTNKQTGLLVAYRDKKQWLEAISMLLDNPDLAGQLTEQAKQDLKKFNWNNLVKATINIFRDLYN